MKPDELFMEEVCHRADLFRGAIRTGNALTWCRQGDNLVRLAQWRDRACAMSAGEYSVEDVRRFWQSLSGTPEMAGFIRCLGGRGATLYRRGRAGELCSVPVFYLVVRNFFTDYIRYDESRTTGGNIPSCPL
ncbi:TPA: hypothetical protein N3A08_004568 [Salmonella enterica subsp. salamae serovar 9,46:z4,z24:z39:z42]|nr:hypothetical protein [Salmonella enterica subsp. salamae serovar 9,46:z4,z24:z39:z42]